MHRHGAKLGYPRGLNHLRFVSGGKRVRFQGRWWRGVSPEFRTRARKLPVRRKRCTVAILPPQRTSARAREVPCT